MRVRVEVIIRANDRRVASRVAAAEPALFEYRDIADAMFLREVIRGGESVSAPADDDDIVVFLRRRAPPRERPVLVAANRIADEREDRIALHTKVGSETTFVCWWRRRCFGKVISDPTLATESATGMHAFCLFED